MLTTGLGLYSPYSVSGYGTLYTSGLRNLTGRINADGTVTLYAVTSTESASGDAGADPNEVVSITDSIAATSLPSAETFSTVESPQFGVVYRGVALAPALAAADVPEPASLALLAFGVGATVLRRRRGV